MDPDELAEIFTRDRARLRRTVLVRLDARLLGRVDVDDVLQESYLAARSRLVHYRPEDGSKFVWCRLIVVQTIANVTRHHLGAQRRSAAREAVAPLSSAAASGTAHALAARLVCGATSPTDAAARAEAVDLVIAAIQGLPPIDQEVLTMRHFEELTNGEVAEALGLHKAAATNRYLRAMERLRAALARSENQR